MKLSLNTILATNKRYGSADDITKIGVEQLIDKIGAQLGAVEEVIQFGEKYQGVVVVKVVSCEPHPDADRLHVCTVDDGGITPDVKRDANGYVQVVCGAPNVREGLTAAWLPPKAVVPETYGSAEPFVLEARELRGVVSNGMLASPKELALGESHEGLLELDDDIKAGTSFVEAYNLRDDIVLDIENKMFTHRPDCFGFLGVARELAGIQGLSYKSPDWFVTNPEFPGVEAEELPLTVTNELPELVPRFTAVTLRDVKVGPSPVWLQIALAKVGQNSINNIVDYTNYFMLLTGQPLHAFDYDKVKALSSGDQANIVIRNPKSGEKLTLLNGKVLEPRAEAIMIATDKQLIGIGGVKGGLDTGVDENTKNVILECANFDMYSIRRTSMEHGIFTDSVTRFNKGQSPLQNLTVLAKIVDEIRTHAEGKVASALIDNNNLDKKLLERESLYPPIQLTTEFVNSRLGLELSAEQMATLLTNVEFKVEVSGDQLTITAPFWRTDVELREDVVEEIGRLYGYDHLPLSLPSRDLTPVAKDKMLEFKSKIRSVLSGAGANEILTYSFVNGDLIRKCGQDPEQAYQVSNALSPDLQYYRLSLTPSLLDKVHANIKAGYGEFAIFEIGKAHVLGREEDGLPIEFERLAVVLSADKKTAAKYSGAAYYQAKTYLSYLLNELMVGHEVVYEQLKNDENDSSTPYYAEGRAATIKINGKTIGRIGEYKPSVTKALKLPSYTAGFELGLGPLLEVVGQQSYLPLLKFPSIKQDITLKVDNGLTYQEVSDFVYKEYGANAPDDTMISLSPVDIYQSKEDADHKQITFRLTTTGTNRTLTDAEVNKLLDKIAEAAQTKIKATRI